jgi:hypothetical protein
LTGKIAGADDPTEPAPVVALEGITKRFGATLALKNVSLHVAGGEALALLGENGAGQESRMGRDAGTARVQWLADALVDVDVPAGLPQQVHSKEPTERAADNKSAALGLVGTMVRHTRRSDVAHRELVTYARSPYVIVPNACCTESGVIGCAASPTMPVCRDAYPN